MHANVSIVPLKIREVAQKQKCAKHLRNVLVLHQLHTGDSQNMQQHNTFEMPPSADDYTKRKIGTRGDNSLRDSAPPSRWEHEWQQQYPDWVLPPLWTKDPRSWLTLAESTFNRHGIVDSRLRFDLTLPALPWESIKQVRGILHAVDDLAEPYVALKERLLEIYTPNPLEQCFKLLYAAELGDERRPSQIMESMLALLPPGELDGLLFKTIFLARLPSKIRGHVAAQFGTLTSRQMGALADNLWFAGKQPLRQQVPVGGLGDCSGSGGGGRGRPQGAAQEEKAAAREVQ